MGKKTRRHFILWAGYLSGAKPVVEPRGTEYRSAHQHMSFWVVVIEQKAITTAYVQAAFSSSIIHGVWMKTLRYVAVSP